MTSSVREIVGALEQAMLQRIGEPRYRLWFDGKTKFSWQEDQLLVGVPNLHFQEWLQKTFADTLRQAAAEVDGGTLPGVPSTVLDLTGPEPSVLRVGAVPAEEALERLRDATQV